MKTVIPLLLLLVLHTSCKQAKYNLRQPEKNGKVIMSIERTPCFGTCATYSATLYENGLLLYDGKRFTTKIGCYYTLIPKSETGKVKAWFEEAGFWKMKEKYPEEDIVPTDLPTCSVFFNNGKQGKRVLDRGWETPTALTELQNTIDAWIDNRDLQPCYK
ncbi:MAG: hypothetical protein KIS94_15115 [Chitinophagales bacterium]|nr:hypothetical protein [Chitinophagales bacterium]